MELIEIPVQSILLPPPVPAGMNYLALGSIAYAAKTQHQHLDPPGIVDEVFPGIWRIVEGRHRFFGAVIAGRPTIQTYLRGSIS